MTQTSKRTLKQDLELQYVDASGNATRDNTLVYALYQTARASLSKEDKYSILEQITKFKVLDEAETLFFEQARDYVFQSKENKIVEPEKRLLILSKLYKLGFKDYSNKPLDETAREEDKSQLEVKAETPAVIVEIKGSIENKPAFNIEIEQYVPNEALAVIADQQVYGAAKESSGSWRGKLTQAAFTFGTLAAVTIGSFLSIPNYAKQKESVDDQPVFTAAPLKYIDVRKENNLPSGSAVIALDKGELEAVVADHNRLGLTGPVRLPLLEEPKLPAKSRFVGTWSEYFRELNESNGKPVVFPKVPTFWEELRSLKDKGLDFIMFDGRYGYASKPIPTEEEIREEQIKESRAKGEGFMVIAEKGKDTKLLRFGNNKKF